MVRALILGRSDLAHDGAAEDLVEPSLAAPDVRTPLVANTSNEGDGPLFPQGARKVPFEMVRSSPSRLIALSSLSLRL